MYPDVVKKLSDEGSDINEHVYSMYDAAVEQKPKVIVELGVRGGVSTKVLYEAAKKSKGKLISVDIEDCSNVLPYDSENWYFYQKDDIEFAKEFPELFDGETIDVLFIDTSHLYEHTVEEIKAFFPLLSEKATVMFHDTNLTAWDNKRGVIRALEDHFESGFNESEDFYIVLKGWRINHYSSNNGFTILRR